MIQISSFVKVFSCRDEMVNWARDVGKGLGYVVVTTRSDTGGASRNVFFYIRLRV